MLKYSFHKILKNLFSLKKYKSFTNRMLIFMEAIPAPVFWLDHNKVYQGCNQVFSDLMGLRAPSHIVGLRDKDLFHSSEELSIRDDIFSAVLENIPQAKVLYDCIVGAENKVIWVQKRFMPLKNKKGKVIGIFGSVVDISEKVSRRKEIDIALGHKATLESMLLELNSTPVLSAKYNEFIEKSIVSLQKESQASLAIFIKEKDPSPQGFLRFATLDLNAEELFNNKSLFLRKQDQSGYLSEEEIKNFQDIGEPIESIFYYRINLNDFVKCDEIILLINPHKNKLEAASAYFALTHHIISYFHVSGFVATASQLSQHIKKPTTNFDN